MRPSEVCVSSKFSSEDELGSVGRLKVVSKVTSYCLLGFANTQLAREGPIELE